MSVPIIDYTDPRSLRLHAALCLDEYTFTKQTLPSPSPSDALFLETISSLDDTNIDFRSVGWFFTTFQELFIKVQGGNRYFAHSPGLGVEDVTDLKDIDGMLNLGTWRQKEKEGSIRWRVLGQMIAAEINGFEFAHPFKPVFHKRDMALCTSNLTVVSERRLMGPVQLLSEPGHSLWVEIKDNSVKVCDPNIEGLQEIAALEIINFANKDELCGNPEGWCQTWSAFAIECLARGSTLHNDLVKCCKDNQFMMDSDLGKRFVQLFDPEGFKAGMNTKALTTFIRKYALRTNTHFKFELPKIKDPQPIKDPLDPKYKDQLVEYKNVIPSLAVNEVHKEDISRHKEKSEALTKILCYYKKLPK